MSETSFQMTRDLALEIKSFKVDHGCTYRSVARRFIENHPDLPVEQSQVEGISLCEEAGKVLEEDHWQW